MDKNEKYLKSIDNTLQDILKELKRQGRVSPLNEAGHVTMTINEQIGGTRLPKASEIWNSACDIKNN